MPVTPVNSNMPANADEEGVSDAEFQADMAAIDAMGHRLFTPTLTPAAVAANSTAEQTFFLSNSILLGQSVVFVNKGSFQAGLGIVGARVPSTGNVAVTFINTTGSPITPASEVYRIGVGQ
ncbi:MAG TPA: hypothetical protein VK009_24630 [Chloroflexota bacterium]|nr:hypothetical protein [Chloroflexota bacterium]